MAYKERIDVMNQGISLASEADAKEILEIYAPYIKNTVITFEYEVPTLEEFTQRIRLVNAQYPYLVYRDEGKIVAYAYASSFKTRAAFSWDVETSIYVHPDYHHTGIAKKLYQALIALLKLQGYYHVYVYISYPNESSVRFHEKLGFTTCGMYEKTGYKHGAWRDLICMELSLRPQKDLVANSSPEKCILITDLKKETIENILTANS